MDILITVLLMVACLAAEAFFSGAEMGVVSADRMKLRHDAARGSRGAKLALSMLKKPEWLLTTTLVGTNISVVTNTTMATALTIQLFGESYSWLTIVFIAPLIWIFGEIVSKSVFQQRADAITPKAIFLLRAASYLFFPILWIFTALTRGLAWALGGGEPQNPFTLREEIVTLMEVSVSDGDIMPSEKKMIRRVFNFGETTAGDIMVPLIDVAGVEHSANCGQAIRVSVDQAHKRLTVYDERVDRIVGSLNALELMLVDHGEPIEPRVRQVRYVPGSKGIEDLLLDFRREGDTMVVVVDEFGGAEGIVMLEDILEEVVGEIEDEFDDAQENAQWMRKMGERDYLVSARVELDTLAEDLGITVPEGDYETLAGFLIERIKDIPPAGMVVRHRDVSFTVERATEQAIQEVRVRW